jgi:hypothetical protein
VKRTPGKGVQVRTILLGLILTTMSFAADVVGKWSGTINMTSDGGEAREQPALLIFKMDGDKLSGSGGPNEERQMPFEGIKVDGDNLTFTVVDGEVRVEAAMKVNGDTMTGEAKIEREGQKRVAKFDLKRSKA